MIAALLTLVFLGISWLSGIATHIALIAAIVSLFTDWNVSFWMVVQFAFVWVISTLLFAVSGAALPNDS